MMTRTSSSFVVIILCAALYGPINANGPSSAASPTQTDWAQVRKDVGQRVDDVRDWFSTILNYGQEIIGKAQSVEMLPYRYVFLISALGGATGALIIYALLRSAKKIKKYEIRKKDLSYSFFKPLTFRDLTNQQDSQMA